MNLSKVHIMQSLIFLTILNFDNSNARPFSEKDTLSCLVSERDTKDNIIENEKFGIRSAHVRDIPWRDIHWRIDQGLIGMRYNSLEFELAFPGWSHKHRVIQNENFSKILNEPSESRRNRAIERLSPAEKYDLLVGDENLTLTKANWALGKKSKDEKRAMTLSMGVCDGTAAASAIYPEPTREVRVPFNRGKFYMTLNAVDIKALASLLWADFNVSVPLAGTKCSHRFPKKRRLQGRYVSKPCIDTDCFDVNPATWHFAATYLMGVKKYPLIIDRDSFAGIFNSPVIRFKFQYRNPQTLKYTNKLEDALVDFLKFQKNDDFKSLRSPGTRLLVGVLMDVTVGNISWLLRTTWGDNLLGLFPYNGSISAEELNYTYHYDLELDSQGRLLGGEWRRDTHPDLLWIITPEYGPELGNEMVLNKNAQWNGVESVPTAWLPQIQAASRNLKPSQVIVEKLIELSSRVPQNKWVLNRN